MNSKPLREARAPLAAFTALFLLFLTPFLLVRQAFLAGDYSVQHYPWAVHLAECLRAGSLPLWTNLMTNGFPLVAEGQVAAFYPYHWLYAVLPFDFLYAWSAPLHMLVSAAGFYLYLRKAGSSPAAAVTGATVLCFGSGFAGCYYNAGSLRVLAWLPWVLYSLENVTARGRRGAWIAILAALVYLQWTAGFAQIAVYSFLYCAAHEALAWRRRGPRPVWTLAAALCLGTALAWPQISATLELIPLSARHGESTAFALWGSVPPAALASLLFPEWGNALRVSFYVGIVPLVLILSSGFAKASVSVRRHWILAAIFFLLALGRFNPIYAFGIDVLGLSFLRNPSKFLFFTIVSLSCLAAAGWDAWIQDAVQGRKLRGRVAVGVAAAAALLPAAGFAMTAAVRPHWPRFSQWYVARILAEKGADAKPATEYALMMTRFFDSLTGLFSYANPFNLNAAAWAGGFLFLAFHFRRKRIGSKAFAVGAALLLTADLYSFGLFLGTGFIGNAANFSGVAAPKFVAELPRESGETPSVVEWVSDPGAEALPPSSNMAHGVSHPGGYSPLLLKNYYDLTRDLGIVDASLGRKAFSAETWKAARPLLDFLGVKYVRADRPLESLGGFKSVSVGDKGERIYENSRSRPAVALYHDWKAITAPDERVRYMNSAAFDALGPLIVHAPRPYGSVSIAPVAVEVRAGSRGGLDFTVKTDRPGTVFIRQAFYPGWKAFSGGKELLLYEAAHAFTAFDVDAGEYDVKMRYRPGWMSIYGWIPPALAGIILFVLVLRRKK